MSTSISVSISIRKAESSDAQLLFEMIRDLAVYEREEPQVKVTVAELERQLASDLPPFECAIAEIDGKACGFALYFYAYSTWEGKQTLYLEDLFVYPEYRGGGAGQALMIYLAQTASRNKCRRFEWSVLDWNEPAIRFYNFIGARPVCGWTRYRMDADAIQSLIENGFDKSIEKSGLAKCKDVA